MKKGGCHVVYVLYFPKLEDNRVPCACDKLINKLRCVMNKSLEPLIVILAIIIKVVVIHVYNVSRHLLD